MGRNGSRRTRPLHGDRADLLLIAALRAAEGRGRRHAGRQSAALVVVPGQGDPWTRRFDLRVEDHRDPIGELARVLTLARAYEHLGQGLDLAGRMSFADALEETDRAAALAPDDDQVAFFRAMMLPPNGLPVEAREEMDRIRAIEPRWGPYVWRSAPKRGSARTIPTTWRRSRRSTRRNDRDHLEGRRPRARVETARDDLLDLSHRIHAHPELGTRRTLREHWLARRSSAGGFDVQRGVLDLPTAVAPGGGPGRCTWAICAEYDALPESATPAATT